MILDVDGITAGLSTNASFNCLTVLFCVLTKVYDRSQLHCSLYFRFLAFKSLIQILNVFVVELLYVIVFYILQFKYSLRFYTFIIFGLVSFIPCALRLFHSFSYLALSFSVCSSAPILLCTHRQTILYVSF